MLRTSADGKLTISYVCNPASDAYNSVEVMYWDDATRTFKTASFNFRNPATGGTAPRTERNPQACVTCHSDSRIGGQPSLHPNWPEYFTWGDCQRERGITFYGSNDDNMDPTVFRRRIHSTPRHNPQGCTDATDRTAHTAEVRDFDAFRQAQRNNPCYSSLPWAQIPAAQANQPPYDQYRYYPFAVRAQRRDEQGLFNYSLRTNTRITDTYSHLMAQRIQRIMRDSPNYERLKYYLAMEGAGCLTTRDDAVMNQLVPGYRVNRTSDPGITPNILYMSPQLTAPVLYSFGQGAGLAPGDWSMEFDRRDDPAYNAVMFRGRATGGGGDWGVSSVVQGARAAVFGPMAAVLLVAASGAGAASEAQPLSH